LAAKAFAQLTGAKVISGRFIPGMFTNVARKDFVEPKLVLICDPKGERQAVVECGNMGLATIGLCDTDNYTMFIDWIIPCNNKGRRSLSLIFWLLAREFAMAKGKISSYDDFTPDFEAFEAISAKIAEDEEAAGKLVAGEEEAEAVEDSQTDESEPDAEDSSESEGEEDDANAVPKKEKASDKKAASTKPKKKRTSKPKAAKKDDEKTASDGAEPKSDSESKDEDESDSTASD
jgi:ribosomal protein S2